jgi:flagellar assembly factor FliW
MQINTSRFGTIDLNDGDVIRFPAGIIGFPAERTFVLLTRRERSSVGWLQSTMTPWFALPIVSVSALAGAYSTASVEGSIGDLGIEFKPESCAIMVVLHVSTAPNRPTVNLVAPIVINSETRMGAQVLIDGSQYSTQEPFVLRGGDSEKDSGASREAQTSAAAPSGV